MLKYIFLFLCLTFQLYSQNLTIQDPNIDTKFSFSELDLAIVLMDGNPSESITGYLKQGQVSLEKTTGNNSFQIIINNDKIKTSSIIQLQILSGSDNILIYLDQVNTGSMSITVLSALFSIPAALERNNFLNDFSFRYIII